MKEPIIGKKILTVMFGILLIGGAAAILGFYRGAKNTERPFDSGMEEYDADIFV